MVVDFVFCFGSESFKDFLDAHLKCNLVFDGSEFLILCLALAFVFFKDFAK